MNDTKKFALETAFKYSKCALIEEILSEAQKIEDYMMGKQPAAKDLLNPFEIKPQDHPNNILEIINRVQDESKFINEYCNLLTPVGNVPFKLMQDQKRYLYSLQTNRRVVLVGKRQCGMTSLIAAHCLHEALFSRTTTLLTAPSFYRSIEILEKTQYMYTNLPDYMKAPVSNFNKSDFAFQHGSKVIARALSSDAGRGLSVNTIIIENCDEISWSKSDDLWQAITPIIAPGGKIIMTVTTEDGKMPAAEGLVKKALDANFTFCFPSE